MYLFKFHLLFDIFPDGQCAEINRSLNSCHIAPMWTYNLQLLTQTRIPDRRQR